MFFLFSKVSYFNALNHIFMATKGRKGKKDKKGPKRREKREIIKPQQTLDFGVSHLVQRHNLFTYFTTQKSKPSLDSKPSGK